MARGANNPRPPPADSSSGSSSFMEDSSSPHFLHNGDHPGLVLVSHSLTGSNFSSWKRAMLLALTAKNKLVFVDGSILRPSPNDLLFPSWTRCNSMVISWILNSVTKEIADSLLYFTTGYEVWNDLQTRFSQANGPRIFQLKQHVSSFSQGSLDVNAYYTRLKSLWDELQDHLPLPSCTCGALHAIRTGREQDHVLQFLIGLNDSFSSVRAQILLLEPLPSLAKVFSMILQEERQRQLSISLPIPVVPDSPLINSAAPPSHNPPTAAATFQRRPRSVCTFCNLSGHTRDKCFKLHGYPPGYKPRSPRPNPTPHQAQAHFAHSRPSPPLLPLPSPASSPHLTSPTATHSSDVPLAFTPTQYNQLLALLHQNSAPSSSFSTSSVTDSSPSIASFSGKPPLALPPSCWILDTGATHHVCLSATLFSSSSSSDSLVSFPNGSSAVVTDVGSVSICGLFTLHNVLCVPSFFFNLLSISALTRDSPILAHFSDSHCSLQDRASARTIGIARRHGDLYILDTTHLFPADNVPHSFCFSFTKRPFPLAFQIRAPLCFRFKFNEIFAGFF
ncbi:uncharacterized protein LOC133317230 [Gastrolobium bilobum]|uniref:uncharacterized protein LOC133317230 n=1 Tax=Gastrolobium bilobum TaxID=150636 RepID=UPI002AB21BA4|nr:uncharacterized protein LOC133317230 [Gastrolobium bilobum]